MYNINQNQTAETTHLSNNTHTTINLSVPKKDNPTMLPNIKIVHKMFKIIILLIIKHLIQI